MSVSAIDEIERLITSEEDSELDGEDDEEEEVEPKIKYERLGNDLTSILSHDQPTCLAVHSKFIALGTHLGLIRLLDLMGNNIRQLPQLLEHSVGVNFISIDDNGDYMVSCSDDGKVIINGLYTTENNQVLTHDRPIKAVSIDPIFYKSGCGRRFVTGEDTKLVLHEKGFLNRHKTFLLHQGESSIKSIKWKGQLIAYSNSQGVNVFDMSVRKRISFISWEGDVSIRTDAVRCNLCWKNEQQLLIGWGRTIKICSVRDPPPAVEGREPPLRYVEINGVRSSLEYLVSGLAPLGDNLVVLSYDEQVPNQPGATCVPNRPHLRLLSAFNDEEISNDALSIKGFQENRCLQYQLECNVEEAMFFIVSPKDFVVVKQRDEDDHITWLIEHEAFEEAMNAATEHSKLLKKHSLQSIGVKYFDSLLESENFDSAARLCKKLLGKSKELWESYICRFTQINQIPVIAQYMPTKEPQLSKHYYELVLNDFLQTNHEMFYQLIRDWPSDIYTIETIVNAILDKLDRDRNNKILLESLALLYTHDKRHDKALYIYLTLKHSKIFELIHQYNLFDTISNRLVQLMEFDQNAAVKMLLDNMDKIPMEKVVQQLEQHPRYLHTYLDQLFHKDPHMGRDYHGRQVKLYAEFDRPKLLPFLKASNYCSLQQSLKECEERSFHQERIFLLDRMGNTKQALQLITTELQDVNKAIEFCKDHDDGELWEDLINYSTEKPSFITGLLNNIGTHVDPIILIQKIREKLEIPGLRDSLVKILQDYYLQISLREGCKKIIVSDCYHLLGKLVKLQRKGIHIEESQSCKICHEKIIFYNIKFATTILVYYCHHTFHEDCLPTGKSGTCPICSAQKRVTG